MVSGIFEPSFLHPKLFKVSTILLNLSRMSASSEAWVQDVARHKILAGDGHLKNTYGNSSLVNDDVKSAQTLYNVNNTPEVVNHNRLKDNGQQGPFVTIATRTAEGGYGETVQDTKSICDSSRFVKRSGRIYLTLDFPTEEMHMASDLEVRPQDSLLRPDAPPAE